MTLASSPNSSGGPHRADYLDEAATRLEMARVFDVCGSCRRCTDLCGAFPTLFDLLDRIGEGDAGDLTPQQQDDVATACHHCGLCAAGCPYSPGLHDAAVDVPRLMTRAQAMRVSAGHVSKASRRATKVFGRVDRLGSTAVRLRALANRVVAAAPGSPLRRLTARSVGISDARLLAPYANERFSTWFRSRLGLQLRRRQGNVVLYPTCVVEYHEPGIGKDIVRVYERNGIECSLSGAGCCGAPWLHGGEIDRFADAAARNVAALDDDSDADVAPPIIVPQSSCASVIRHRYAEHVPSDQRDAAERVAARVRDASEYLLDVHQGDHTRLDTHFDGDVPAVISFHAPCHLRSEGTGFAGRDLLRLTGARVELVQQCAGVGETWGLRSEHAAASTEVAVTLTQRLDRSSATVVAGECHRANLAIAEQTGDGAVERIVEHPLQVLARAYGILDDS